MIPGSNEIALAIAESPALSLIVKATVVTAGALAGTRLARRYRASVRHLMCTAAFVVLLALPLVPFVVPARQVSVPLLDPAPAAAAVTPAPGNNTPMGGSLLADLGPEGTGERQSRALPPLSTILLAIWALGTALVLVPMIAGLIRVRRMRRNGLPWRDGQQFAASIASAAAVRRPIRLLLDTAVDGPMTCGVLRPTILLPSDARRWPVEDLRRAVVHEIEHVRRADWLTLCLARSVCALYWFHPLVWTLRRQLRLEAERACDDAVLWSADPETYADQLVTLAERLVANRTQSALAMAGRDDLSTRVSAMLDLRQSRGRAGSVCIAGAAVAAAVVIAAIAPLRAVAVARAVAAAEALPVAHVSATTDGSAAAVTNEEISQHSRPVVTTPLAAFSARLLEAAAVVFPPPPAPAPAREEAPEAGALERGSAPQAPGAAQLPSFQVASIRPSTSGRPASQRVTPTRLDFVNMSLRRLVFTAYRFEFAYQLSAPAWLDDVRFDIQATYPADARQQVPAMLQRLLVERFGLVAHKESRPIEAYELTVGRDGLKIPEVEAVDDLEKDFKNDATGRSSGDTVFETIDGPVRTMAIPELFGSRTVTDRSLYIFRTTPRQTIEIDATRITMKEFAGTLSVNLGRPVVDNTGLEGVYRFKVELDRPALPRPPDRAPALSEPTGISTFKAVEGLGLRLDERRAPLDVLVIDKIERTPIEN